MWMYSLIWTVRNVRPSRKVDSIPALRPKRLPFLTDVSAQWIVSDDDSRIAVLIPATASGSSDPCAGHGLWVTIRMKKYAVKKAPKIITSDMMKSSIPSVGASTREERCAGGGPWCSAWAMDAASKGVFLLCRRRVGGVLLDDVLNGLVGHPAHALDQVGAQPSGLGLGERRDHDVIHAEVLQGIHDRRVGIGITDHPGSVQAGLMQSVEHDLQASAGTPGGLAVATFERDHDDEQAAALLLLLCLHLGLERVEQLVAAGGAVCDRERDVERQAFGIGVGDHVL